MWRSRKRSNANNVLMRAEPAFPTHGCSTGMSLQDYFAAKAMQAMISRQIPVTKIDADNLAERSYNLADSMMKEREKEK